MDTHYRDEARGAGPKDTATVYLEHLDGDSLRITSWLEQDFGRFLERYGLPDIQKNLLNQLQVTFSGHPSGKPVHLPCALTDELYAFVAHYLPASSFAVLIVGHPISDTRYRKYCDGHQAFAAGPFQTGL
ncbi:MAG: hypothetical protein V4505_15220 [Pseudomonadota bacterium]